LAKRSKTNKAAEDLRKQAEELFSGADDLNSAKDILKNLTDNLKGFESGLLKNNSIQTAKTRHLANLASVLMEVLRENDSCDLNDEDDIIKIAKIFTEKYDTEVLSNIGI